MEQYNHTNYSGVTSFSTLEMPSNVADVAAPLAQQCYFVAQATMERPKG